MADFTVKSASDEQEAKKNETPRQQALRAIEAGGSVIINGVQYTKENVSKLPGEAEFALGNPDFEAAAKQSLDYQIAQLTAQRQLLEQKASADTASVAASQTQPVAATSTVKKDGSVVTPKTQPSE